MQRRLFVAGLVILVVLGSVPLPVAAAEPTVSVAVDGTPMTTGDSLVVPEDPLLTVDANAQTTVERIVVRIDGETVRTWVPGTETVSAEHRLDVANEPEDVQILVTGANGEIATVRITVEKDEVAPFVGFTDPFESDTFARPPSSVELSESRVTLSGDIVDSAGTEVVRIRRNHRVETVFGYDVVGEVHVIRDPGNSFSQELFLGPGENDVLVIVQDRFGNSRDYELQFLVNDTTDPTVSFDPVPNRTTQSTVFVNGTATDNVQVDSINYAVVGEVGRRSIITGQGKTADETRQELDFARGVDLTPGANHVTVWVTDTSGNEVERTFAVTYDRNVVPTVTVDEAQTHRFGDDQIHVFGAARDGRVSAVSVETVDENGNVVAFEQVYDGGGVWNDISFEEELALAASGETTVVVRAVDVDGTEHVTRYVVPAASEDETEDHGGAAGGEGDEGDAAPAAEAEASDVERESGGESEAETGADAAEASGSAAVTGTATAVEDGGFGAFAVAALLVVLVGLFRLRNATIEIPIEKYVDVEDGVNLPTVAMPSMPSLPSLPRLRK